jgi:DeoR/GlpR family transcriptional regulator of sugar metabolism
MLRALPESFERELHKLSNREISTKILSIVQSNPVVCIHEVARLAGCSDITARKNLCRLVKADLAVEKRIGKARVFISKDGGFH